MLTSTSLSGWNIRPCLCARDWVTSTIRCASCRHPVSLFTHVMDWWVSQRQNGFQKFDTTPQLRSSAKIFSSVSGYTQPWGVFACFSGPKFQIIEACNLIGCLYLHVYTLIFSSFQWGDNFWRLDKVILSKQDIVNEYWKTFMCTFLKLHDSCMKERTINKILLHVCQRY